MILVDTSVWIDYLRAGDQVLSRLLVDRQVLAHPFVIGELALGNIGQRDRVLHDIRNLPQAVAANDNETFRFINSHRLFGLGIGYVDAALLASVRLTHGASLWTRDRRLWSVSERMGISAGFLR